LNTRSRRCEGNQIYDTSTCIDCNAECVSASNDPQGRGQFIERECTQSTNDYVCRPCTGACPIGTFISSVCNGKGRTDTGCSFCTSFCVEAQKGVAGAHGQYISGRCSGLGTSDVQTCVDCKQCPAGYYPSGLCDGRSFNDTVECIKCRTTCPEGFYLKGDCRVEEVRCVQCDAPCSNVSEFLRETQACANGTNRVCQPTSRCKDASCPPGYYESSTCTDAEGPKFCTRCRSCGKGEYESRSCANAHNRECKNCTRECPDSRMQQGIVGECTTGADKVDAVSCVQSTSIMGLQPCRSNEWYVGTRTPMFKAAASVQTELLSGRVVPSGLAADDSDIFKSDFSYTDMDKMVFLSLVGSSTESRQTWITLFTREARASSWEVPADHRLRAVMSPRVNYFQRLDYYGSSKNVSIYPVASTTDWNAVDVMLSHDGGSLYIFFSYTYDFIAKCSISNQNITSTADAHAKAYNIPSSECTYLSPKTFVPGPLDYSVTGTTFTYRGCTRMHPMPFLACLYDLQGSRSILYAVDEAREGGPKTVLDTYERAFYSTGENVGRPKSPPAWSPETQSVYYILDLNSGVNMGLRFVQVNATQEAATKVWTIHGTLSSGILWRGSGEDSSNYHSLVMTQGYSYGAKALFAACAPPSCPDHLSLVSFSTETDPHPSSRAAMRLPGSSHITALGVRWSTNGPFPTGHQLYILSREDRAWGLWTQCAGCPSNSFSPAGTSSSSPESGGVGACKCLFNYYGVLVRPVVDQCKACRIRFMADGVTVSPDSLQASCDPGSYKTNVVCTTNAADRSIDSTCAPCISQCRPGNPIENYAGEYVSRLCDGTGYEPSVGCSTCTDQCPSDDQYMDSRVVCSGKTTFDTRPTQACKACTTQCPMNAYVSNRCLRANKPVNNTATCTACSMCSNGQYISHACNGSTFEDTTACSPCRYGRSAESGTNVSPESSALQACPQGEFVLNECVTGMDATDSTQCTSCNSNCVPANYSKGEDGQYILQLCGSQSTGGDNTCAKCSGRCLSHLAKPPQGQYIVGFCTGMTQFDRQCADCRVSCPPGEYIAGQSCTGEAATDTTFCAPCTPRPGDSHVTLNPCTGTTREDQRWEVCSDSCPAGQYVAAECTEYAYTDCKPCRNACPAGFFLSGSCDGTSRHDSVQCVRCKTCEEGQYRSGADLCSGLTAFDPVQCMPCRTNCSPGQYIFGRCSGLMGVDETSCADCTSCPKDRPAQYNSIYHSCDGSDTEDVVVCAMNDPGSSFPGDGCPPNSFAYGKLDAVDTELRRMEQASWADGHAQQQWVSMYDSVVPYVDRFDPVLQDGGYLIMSKTVWEGEASENGVVVARNTRVEIFRGEAHLYSISSNMGNILGDPLSSILSRTARRSEAPGSRKAYSEFAPFSMMSSVIPSLEQSQTKKNQEEGSSARRLLSSGPPETSVHMPDSMFVGRPHSLRSLLFGITLNYIYMIGGTLPLQSSSFDGKTVMRSIYALSTTMNPAEWVLVFDGGPVASSIVQIQACASVIDDSLPDSSNKGIVACSYTSSDFMLRIFSLDVGNRHSFALLWENSTMNLEGTARTFTFPTYLMGRVDPTSARLRYTTELVPIPKTLSDRPGYPDMIVGVPKDQQQSQLARMRVAGEGAGQYDYLPCLQSRCGIQNFVSMAFNSGGHDLFAVDEQPSIWRWRRSSTHPSGFYTTESYVYADVHAGHASVWKLMVWSNHRLIAVTDKSINLWTQCSPCPEGTVTNNASSNDGVRQRCICPSGTYNNLVDFRSRCTPCTTGPATCPGGYYRTLQDPACPTQGYTYDGGCARCTAQKDCPPKRVASGELCLGNGISDTISCIPCPNQCTPGQTFISNNCAADSFAICTSCMRSCGTHRYISANCTIETDTGCAPCSQTCPAGMYLSKACAGASASDTSECLNCSSIHQCPMHDASSETSQYYVDLTECQGNTLFPTIDKVCKRCTAQCPPGTWERAPCTQFKDRDCVPCTICLGKDDHGTYQVSACTAFNDTVCRNCTQCKAVIPR